MKRVNLWTLALLCFAPMLLTGQDFYDLKKVVEVKIQFKQPNWQVLLDSLKGSGEDGEDRLLADVTVNGKLFPGAGVRYKGNSSYNSVRKAGLEKLPLNIKLNNTDKSLALPGGYKTLKLANGFRDPSMLREVMAYEIARNYMPASRANFAKVWVNGEFLGVYTNVESVDDSLLDRTFATHEGILIKCDVDWSVPKTPGCPEGDKSSLQYLGDNPACYQGLYEWKSDTGWTELINLTRILTHQYQNIDQVLDVDQALWMLAFDNVLVNLDSYLGAFCHNYYLYRDTSGIFHPIIWDMNLAFGGFRMLKGEERLSDQEMKEMSMFVHYKDLNAKRPLILQLLRIDLYRKMYIAHIKTILEEQFTNGQFDRRLKELNAFIAPVVKQDSQYLYSFAAFQGNMATTQDAGGVPIIGLQELMTERVAYLTSHPLLSVPDPVISEVKATVSSGSVRISAQVTGAERVWLCYRAPGGINFKRVAMDQGGNGVVQAQLPATAKWEYYLIAEGEKSASLSPRRAGFSVHKVN